jgi:UPF0716 protein FxsA
VLNRLPDRARGPVRVQSTRPAQVDPEPSAATDRPAVIEGTVVER